MSELFPSDETRRAMLGFYADTIGAFGRGLSDAVVELHAIENYFFEIGAVFDGERVRDIRTCVHIALDRASRTHRHVMSRPSSRAANGIC